MNTFLELLSRLVQEQTVAEGKSEQLLSGIMSNSVLVTTDLLREVPVASLEHALEQVAGLILEARMTQDLEHVSQYMRRLTLSFVPVADLDAWELRCTVQMSHARDAGS